MADQLLPEAQYPQWRVVLTTNNPSEAHIVAGRLQSAGLAAQVHQEPAGSALGIMVGMLGEIKVIVLSEDYDQALALLDTQPDADTDDLLDTL